MTIIMGGQANEWTLTEAARILGEPQHRLIYLCEKGLVKPDIQDAEGRGSSRRFSARNLLEFAIALRLRELEMSASLAAGVIHVLRAFERRVRKQIPEFRLPESLREAGAPDLRVLIGDGQRLFFTLGDGKSDPKVYGGVDLREVDPSKKSLRDLERELVERKSDGKGVSNDLGSNSHARVELSVTGIAQDLRLEG